MTTTMQVKPATPLPILRVNAAGHRGDYSIDNEGSSIEFGRFGSREIAHEVVRRANAFPELVAALEFAESCLRETAPNPQRHKICRNHLSALLAKLGEGA